MINRVVLTGRPTKKPVLRHTNSGIAVAQCTLAVDRQYTNSQGQRQADFISLVLWRKSAENFVKYVEKGQLVGIDGRLQTRSYENKNGQKVYITEVVVDQFAFLTGKKDNSNNNSSDNNPSNINQNNTNNDSTQNTSTDNNSTSNNPSSTSDSFSSNGEIDISDDDLPF